MAGYLDHASSEPLHPAAREALLAALDTGFADPARLHRDARQARLLLDNAREATAALVGCRPDEVTFTGSGTTAVHRGLLGLLLGRTRVSRRVLHSAVEHSAVLAAADWWATHFEGSVGSVPVDPWGRVREDELASALAEGPTAVVALQSANLEVGTVQPVDRVVELAGSHDVPVFCDLAASVGREALPSGWSVGAASAHKWGGPAGVGLLLVRKHARWRNAFPVDDRLDRRVSGFENVPGVLAAAAALQAVCAERTLVAARQRRLVDRLRQGLLGLVDVEVAGDPHDRLPHVLTFSCLYVEGEALVTELDRLGFAVSSGSACSASTLEPSHVLAAMGALTHGNVRLAVGRETTEADVDRFLAAVVVAVDRLRGVSA